MFWSLTCIRKKTWNTYLALKGYRATAEEPELKLLPTTGRRHFIPQVYIKIWKYVALKYKNTNTYYIHLGDFGAQIICRRITLNMCNILSITNSLAVWGKKLKLLYYCIVAVAPIPKKWAEWISWGNRLCLKREFSHSEKYKMNPSIQDLDLWHLQRRTLKPVECNTDVCDVIWSFIQMRDSPTRIRKKSEAREETAS